MFVPGGLPLRFRRLVGFGASARWTAQLGGRWAPQCAARGGGLGRERGDFAGVAGEGRSGCGETLGVMRILIQTKPHRKGMKRGKTHYYVGNLNCIKLKKSGNHGNQLDKGYVWLVYRNNGTE